MSTGRSFAQTRYFERLSGSVDGSRNVVVVDDVDGAVVDVVDVDVAAFVDEGACSDSRAMPSKTSARDHGVNGRVEIGVVR